MLPGWSLWSAICFKIMTRYTCGFYPLILAIIPATRYTCVFLPRILAFFPALWGFYSQVYHHFLTNAHIYAHKKAHILACVAGAKRGGRGGGRKGKGKGAPAIKGRCFCNPPTIFSTNPIMSLSIRGQSQVRGFSAWSELNYFVYRKLSS